MEDNSIQLILCPLCGSTDYLENYPVEGASTCTDCGHEVTSVSLNEIQGEIEDVSSICTSCGKDNEAEKPIFEKYNKYVYKCTLCGKLEGYLMIPPTFGDNERINDNDFDGLSVTIAKTEGQLIYPGYSSKKEPNATGCIKEFETLINEKKEILMNMGVDFKTIK